MKDSKVTVQLLNSLSDLWTLEKAFLQEIGEEPMSKAACMRLERAIADGKIVFWIAKVAENPVGMCSISPNFSTYACKTCGVFDDFYLLPAFRGRGIAKQLVENAVEWCKNHDYASITVGCSVGDEAMYRSLDFETKLGVMLANNL